MWLRLVPQSGCWRCIHDILRCFLGCLPSISCFLCGWWPEGREGDLEGRIGKEKGFWRQWGEGISILKLGRDFLCALLLVVCDQLKTEDKDSSQLAHLLCYTKQTLRKQQTETREIRKEFSFSHEYSFSKTIIKISTAPSSFGTST